MSIRLAVGFVFVLLCGILSALAFLMNCFYILLRDEWITYNKFRKFNFI